jgi:hypothetical protein
MNEETVREIARAADLPLGPERPALIAPQLATWLDAANELSRKMSAPEHLTLTPITVFRHPVTERGEE